MTVKNRRYYRAWLVIAPTVLLSALMFSAHAQSTPDSTPDAPPDSTPDAAEEAFSEADVANYASAVVAIEEKRLVAYETASDVLAAAGDEKGLLETQLSCEAHKLSDMPDNLSKSEKVDLLTVLVEFCEEARTTAEANDLTPTQFNSITAAHPEDPELTKRIQAAIGEL
jgi:Domain of unknown function (DUF4168)